MSLIGAFTILRMAATVGVEGALYLKEFGSNQNSVIENLDFIQVRCCDDSWQGKGNTV